MGILDKLGGEALKKTLIKNFTEKMRAEGVKKVFVELLDDGEIKATPLTEGEIVVKEADYLKYKNYFLRQFTKD